MTYTKNLLLALPLILAATAFAQTAQAQLVVHGQGDAAICYQQSVSGNKGSQSAIKTCTEALTQFLSEKDEAATFVNRGVLYMRRGDQTKATQDYEAAIEMRPELTEAYINYAASLIMQKKFDESLVMVTKALDDKKSKTRPEALYNRAVILDHKDDYRGAYRDLKEALTLRPDWKPALKLISRYEVRPSG